MPVSSSRPTGCPIWRQGALAAARREHGARALRHQSPLHRSRPLVPRQGTPLFEEVEQERMHLSSPHERLQELALMIEGLDVTSRVCFDHAMNAWVDRDGGLLFRQDYEATVSRGKAAAYRADPRGLGVEESEHLHVRKLMAVRAL